jgi:heptosyltransferase III
VGNLAAARLAPLAGLADAWTAFDDPAVGGLFTPSGPGPAAAFGPILTAVAWCGDPDGVLVRNLGRLGAEQVIVAPSRPPPDEVTHVADHLVDTLRPLGINPEVGAAPIRFDIPESLAVAAEDHLRRLDLAGRRFIAVHPGSGSPRKNWPPESLAVLLERVPTATGAIALLLAGPADGEAVSRLLACLSRRPPILRDVPLPVLAAVLRQADAYLGNDSGPTHLAAILGRPTLALFGPTDPALWAPRGPRVRILRHQPLADLRLDAVLRTLTDML